MTRNTKQTLRQKRNAIKKLTLSKSFRVGLLVALLSLLVLDVFKTSIVSASGSDINTLKREVRELTQENERLDFEIAQYRSMNSIQARLSDLELVQSGTPSYVSLLEPTIALR